MRENGNSGRESPPIENLTTEAELETAVERATRKLKWIISHAGDADGERRKDYYFQQLIREALQEERLRRSFNGEKKRDCPQNRETIPLKATSL